MGKHNRPVIRLFRPGFTLAELLIAMLILGIIATFTIPKVLVAQNNAKFNAIAKEIISSFAGATLAYQADNGGGLPTTIRPIDLTPYLNYVKIDTQTPIDDWPGLGSWGCDNTNQCLLMHNGARVELGTSSFSGTATNNMIFIQVDPDGQYSGTTNGAGKAIYFALYYNGRVRTKATVFTGSVTSSGTVNPTANDPSWFSW